MKTITLIIALAITGCVAAPPRKQGPIENSRVLPTSQDATWTKVIQTLAAEGYPILQTMKESGVITTGKKTMRLTEEQADCGSVMGFGYISDERTVTNVSHSILIAPVGNQTRVTVNTQIEGLFNAAANVQSKPLSCMTTGGIEKDLLSKF